MKKVYPKLLLLLASLYITNAQAVSGPVRHIYNALDVPINYTITVTQGKSATVTCQQYANSNNTGIIPAHSICTLTADGIPNRELFYFDAIVKFTWSTDIGGTYRLDGYSDGGAQLVWENGEGGLANCGSIIFNRYPATPDYDKQPFEVGTAKVDIIFWQKDAQPRCSM